VKFFTKLGFAFNPQFTDKTGTCMLIGEDSYVMLLTEPFFKTFIKKEITHTAKSTEVIVSLSTESREEVDELVKKAVAAGATTPNPLNQQEGMYGRSFEDLDGHSWEVIYMGTRTEDE
jgi:hypothetical protein